MVPPRSPAKRRHGVHNPHDSHAPVGTSSQRTTRVVRFPPDVHIKRDGNGIDVLNVMAPDLSTTNLLLGLMAAVSVLEAFAVVALLTGGFLVYRRVMRLLDELEQRQIAPAMARLNAVLDDVKTVTSVVKGAAHDVDAGVRWGCGSLLGWLLNKWPSSPTADSRPRADREHA